MSNFRTCIFLVFLAAWLVSCSSDSIEFGVTEADKELELQRLASEASPEQIDAFEDGEITDDEYSTAVLASFNCFEQEAGRLLPAGVELQMSGPDRSGQYLSWSFRIGGSDEAALDEADRIVEVLERECRERHDDAIVEAFQVYRIPTGNERRAQLEQLSDCAKGVGVDLPDNFTLLKMDQIAEDDFPAFLDCGEQFPELFFSTRS